MLIFASTYAKLKADSPMESSQTQPHNLSFFSSDTLIPIWESIIQIFSDESHCVFHTKCSHPLWQNSLTFSPIFLSKWMKTSIQKSHLGLMSSCLSKRREMKISRFCHNAFNEKNTGIQHYKFRWPILKMGLRYQMKKKLGVFVHGKR